MSSQTSKQLVVGLLVGGLVFGGVWFMMSGKRDELVELVEANEKLETEVAKGRQLRASYESLKREVEEQEQRIDELIKLFPLETDRMSVTRMVQRLASNAGLGRMQEQKNNPKPIKTDYYSEWETTYKYLGSFHEFGDFLSLASGYEKIINISDIKFVQNPGRNAYSSTIDFRLSVFVYDPKSDELATAAHTGR